MRAGGHDLGRYARSPSMTAPHPYGSHTPKHVLEHFAGLPHFPKTLYWSDHDPIFFRGRLDGSAKVLGVGQDPGVCEHVVRRVFVGTAGQRVQFLLEKLGLADSYVLVNAHQYEIRAGCQGRALSRVDDPILSGWRNKLFELITDQQCLQAVIAFGVHARKAVSLWTPPRSARVFNLKHPTSRNPGVLAADWASEFRKLRAAVSPDPGCQPSRPRFRQAFGRRIRPASPTETLLVNPIREHGGSRMGIPLGDMRAKPGSTPQWNLGSRLMESGPDRRPP